jgi:hypothetical protein
LARTCSRSIFTGATKSEILHYLQDARLRIGGATCLQPLSDQVSDQAYPASASSDQAYPSSEELYSSEGIYLGQRNIKHRISAVSNLSDSSNSSNDRYAQLRWAIFHGCKVVAGYGRDLAVCGLDVADWIEPPAKKPISLMILGRYANNANDATVLRS